MCIECDIEKKLKKVSNPVEGSFILLNAIKESPAFLFCSRDSKTRNSQRELFKRFPIEIEAVIVSMSNQERKDIGFKHFGTTIDWMRALYCIALAKDMPAYLEWVTEVKRYWLSNRLKVVYPKKDSWVVENKIAIKDELEGLDFLNLCHHRDGRYFY